MSVSCVCVCVCTCVCVCYGRWSLLAMGLEESWNILQDKMKLLLQISHAWVFMCIYMWLLIHACHKKYCMCSVQSCVCGRVILAIFSVWPNIAVGLKSNLKIFPSLSYAHWHTHTHTHTHTFIDTDIDQSTAEKQISSGGHGLWEDHLQALIGHW